MRALIVLVVVGLVGCGQTEDAKRLVREELKDGASARFENVTTGELVDGRSAVCGWVSGKNSFGAYAAPEPFLVVEGKVRQLGRVADEGYAGQFGACVAANRAATERMYRDVDRALEAAEA